LDNCFNNDWGWDFGQDGRVVANRFASSSCFTYHLVTLIAVKVVPFVLIGDYIPVRP